MRLGSKTRFLSFFFLIHAQKSSGHVPSKSAQQKVNKFFPKIFLTKLFAVLLFIIAPSLDIFPCLSKQNLFVVHRRPAITASTKGCRQQRRHTGKEKSEWQKKREFQKSGGEGARKSIKIPGNSKIYYRFVRREVDWLFNTQRNAVGNCLKTFERLSPSFRLSPTLPLLIISPLINISQVRTRVFHSHRRLTESIFNQLTTPLTPFYKKKKKKSARLVEFYEKFLIYYLYCKLL